MKAVTSMTCWEKVVHAFLDVGFYPVVKTQMF